MSKNAPDLLNPGLREQTTEKVLLVTRSKFGGGTRIDWWPSEQEAINHDMEILEVRERIALPAKSEARGMFKFLELILGRAASQDRMMRDDTLQQKEWFHRE